MQLNSTRDELQPVMILSLWISLAIPLKIDQQARPFLTSSGKQLWDYVNYIMWISSEFGDVSFFVPYSHFVLQLVFEMCMM